MVKIWGCALEVGKGWKFNVTRFGTIMEHFPKQQRAFAVECYLRLGGLVKLVQREFRKRFSVPPRGRIPQRGTILNWVKNFCESANANDRRKSGRPRMVRTPENVDRVRTSLQTSPRRSLRKRSQALGISQESIRIMIHKDLDYRPFKLCVTQKLHEGDHAKRKSFAE